MRYRRLGKTDLIVSTIGIGTWQWGGEWGRAYTPNDVDMMLRVAGNAGVNLIDTAECYGDHLAERLIGETIKRERERWIISTKFGHRFRGHLDREEAFDRQSVAQQLDASLRALQTDYIDLYLFHSGTDAQLESEGLWQFLHGEVSKGKIRHLGISLSGRKPDILRRQTERARTLGASVIQTVFNPLRPESADEIFPICERDGLGVIGRVPLAQGLFGGAIERTTTFSDTDVRAPLTENHLNTLLGRVDQLRSEHGVKKYELAKWAIAWSLNDPRVSATVVGCKSPEQVIQNAMASRSAWLRAEHPLQAPGPPQRPSKTSVLPSMSVIVVCYNMARELPRTIRSLSPLMQKHMKEEEYEVIVVDNGSAQKPDVERLKAIAPNLVYLEMKSPTPSPVGAIRAGLAAARGELVGVCIDGARMVSPGVLNAARAAAATSKRPAIGTVAFHLGPAVQMVSVLNGYDQEQEDALLTQSGWEDDGYRLFDISVFAGSSSEGWFVTPKETNALFLRAEDWRAIGGFDMRFQSSGGGLANLDTWQRICDDPSFDVIMLLGEATFHQVHGGVATNARNSPWEKFHDEYVRVRGKPYVAPVRTPKLYGELSSRLTPTLASSVQGLVKAHRESVKKADIARTEDMRRAGGDVIPVLFCIDAEPDEFDPKPNDPSAWWHVEDCIARLDKHRSVLAEATGRDVAFNWLVRADAQVGHIYSDAGWGLKNFRSMWHDLMRRGDEVGLHPHPQRWSEERQGWIAGQDVSGWSAAVLAIAHEAYERELNQRPETLRYGNRFMNQEIATKAVELGFKYDLTLEPGYRGRTGRLPEHRIPGFCSDYFDIPRAPYCAEPRNYRAPGKRHDNALHMIPMSTADLTGAAPRAFPPHFRAVEPGIHKYDILHLRISPQEFRVAVDHILSEMTQPYLAVVIRCDMVELGEVWANIEILRTHPRASQFEFATPQRAWRELMRSGASVVREV